MRSGRYHLVFFTAVILFAGHYYILSNMGICCRDTLGDSINHIWNILTYLTQENRVDISAISSWPALFSPQIFWAFSRAVNVGFKSSLFIFFLWPWNSVWWNYIELLFPQFFTVKIFQAPIFDLDLCETISPLKDKHGRVRPN